MTQEIYTQHGAIDAIMLKLGLGEFTNAVIIILALVGLAVLRAIYVGVAYRPLTDEEIWQMQQDPEMFDILTAGKIRRF